MDRDDDLLELVSALGTPTAIGNGSLIHEVSPRPDRVGADLSHSAEAFPLHTDSTFLVEPHDFVALACVEAQDGFGGESRVVGCHALRARIADPGALEALAEPAYPFLIREPGCAPDVRALPILREDDDCWTVRYRSDAVAMALRDSGIELGARHRAALLALEDALADSAIHAAFTLRPGDVLLLDNHRVLHGRTAIAPGARRVLRRLKVIAS